MSGEELLHQLDGSVRDDGARRVDGGCAVILELLEVLGRDDATNNDHDVGAAKLVQFLAQGRHQGEVSGGQRGDTDDVDVALDSLSSGLLRGLEQRADVDVHAEVRVGGRDDLLATVVTILTHLRDHDARTTAFLLLELLDEVVDLLGRLGATGCLAVHALNGTDLSGVAPEDLLHCVGHLADGGVGATGVDAQLEQVAVGIARVRVGSSPGELLQSSLAGLLVTVGAKLLELGLLFLEHLGVVDLEDLEILFLIETVLVDADEGLTTGVDTGLGTGSGLLDTHLRDALLDGLGHTAGLLDLLDVGPGLASQLEGELLDVGGTAPGIDDAAGARLLLDEQLGVSSDTSGEVCRQGDGLVEGVGVQGLGVSLGGSHGLHTGTDDVVVHVLSGQRPARGLRVGTQAHGLRVLRSELVDELGPQHASRAHLGDLHEEVGANGPEEGQTRCELVDLQAHRLASADVVDSVGQGVGHLDVGGRAGLLHVVAGDGDGVPLRHVRAGEGKDVGDDPHRGQRRVDVRVTNHELLEDVVLDRSGELLGLGALLLSGNNAL